MTVVGVAIFSVQYLVTLSLDQMKSSLFVEAGEDLSFETDDIYQSYFASAELQSQLKIND